MPPMKKCCIISQSYSLLNYEHDQKFINKNYYNEIIYIIFMDLYQYDKHKYFRKMLDLNLT
jgi:hypothetical protein